MTHPYVFIVLQFIVYPISFLIFVFLAIKIIQWTTNDFNTFLKRSSSNEESSLKTDNIIENESDRLLSAKLLKDIIDKPEYTLAKDEASAKEAFITLFAFTVVVLASLLLGFGDFFELPSYIVITTSVYCLSLLIQKAIPTSLVGRSEQQIPTGRQFVFSIVFSSAIALLVTTLGTYLLETYYAFISTGFIAIYLLEKYLPKMGVSDIVRLALYIMVLGLSLGIMVVQLDKYDTEDISEKFDSALLFL